MKSIIAIVLLIAIIITTKLFYPSNHTQTITHIGYDMCQHRQLTHIAQTHGATFYTDEHFDMPALSIDGDKETLHAIEQAIANHHTTNPSNTPCHPTGLKYHAKHKNPKLIDFIPDDVDYVSYAPPHIKQDKAVYCYYEFDNQRFNTPKTTSTCYFIHLQDNRLITEDISDLERMHLQIVAYHHRDGLFNPYSHVYEWHDKAHLRYGITFHTKVNNWYHGYAGVY